MNRDRFVDIAREIELALYSNDFRKWLRTLLADQKESLVSLRSDISSYRSGLETKEFEVLAGKLEELAQPLQDGTNELIAEIDKMENAIKTIELLGNVLGLIGKVVAVVAAPAAIPAASLLRARAADRLKDSPIMKALKADRSSSITEEFLAEVSATLSESSVEEKTVPLLLVEEVLHGVEITPEKLTITVATGGCTKEGSFRFDVNKGTTGQMPYMVTVYRIEPDDCEGNFEPIKISYSRKELGLDGTVEFILRNKIGNTSQHRLTN